MPTDRISPEAVPWSLAGPRILSWDVLPAVRFSLRVHRRMVRIALGFGFGVVALQWLLIDLGGIKVARFFPLYVAGWILPASVAMAGARERISGRREALALSGATTFDLWLASLSSGFPWLLTAGLLCLPFWLPATNGVLPEGHSEFAKPGPWVYLGGVLACGAAYTFTAAWCGSRGKSARSALVVTGLINGLLAYGATGTSMVLQIFGLAHIPTAFDYALWFEQQALLAPAWMLGGTLYHYLPESLGRDIVVVTATAYLTLAGLLGLLSYRSFSLQRRLSR